MFKKTLASVAVLCALSSIAAPLMADTVLQAPQIKGSSSDRLWFSLESFFYNYSGESVSGTIYCNVFNPEGKHTFLGSTRFSIGNGDTVPINFDEVKGIDSDDYGLYSMVLGIVFDPDAEDNEFNFEISGYQFIRNCEERRAVSFDYYTEQDIDQLTYQVTIPFYHHKHVWDN